MEDASQMERSGTPTLAILGFLVAGAVLASVPTAWLTLHLSGVTGHDLEHHPIADWANDVWPRCFAVAALTAVLALWCGRQYMWRAWKAFILVSLLVLPTVMIGPLLLGVAFFLTPAASGGYAAFTALLWGMLSLARWIILKTCPEAGPLTAARDRWLLLPLAVVVPALMGYGATLFHLGHFFTAP